MAATSVRRLDGDRVEVIFGKALKADGKGAVALTELAREGKASLIKDHEGLITGVECDAKDYVAFLRSIDAPRASIEAFRGALDDSKKAVRQRQRG